MVSVPESRLSSISSSCSFSEFSGDISKSCANTLPSCDCNRKQPISVNWLKIDFNEKLEKGANWEF